MRLSATERGRAARRRSLVLALAAMLTVAPAALAMPPDGDALLRFEALAARGNAVLGRVEEVPSLGRGKLPMGVDFPYEDRFPTSGPRDPVWAHAGFYKQPQRPSELVGALEHGNVVVYYDQPGLDVLRQLKRWCRLFSGKWDGLVVTPMPELGERIVLTAWTRRLALDSFDPAAAAAFIDAYRGRGPAMRVR